MNKMINIVNEVLATADPMGLIEIGCPYDEYQAEGKAICNYIDNNNPDVNSLSNYIYQVFVTYFETELEEMFCDAIADCILKNLE